MDAFDTLQAAVAHARPYDEAVIAGIEALEAFPPCPQDWYNLVDLSTLDIHDSDLCVLTQVFKGIVDRPVWSYVYTQLCESHGLGDPPFIVNSDRLCIDAFAGVVGEPNGDLHLLDAWQRAIITRQTS